MAINPNLVSITPASELPTGDPTNAGQFFFFEGDEMKKAPMTNIFDKLNSSIVGIATQANAPTAYSAETHPNGLFERYIVHTPITSPNSWSNVVVTAEELNIVSGVAANEVILEVKNGVTTKVVYGKKGSDYWTMQYEDLVSSDKVIRKVTGYTGGSGTVPTSLSANIGKYFAAAGGFTTDTALATNFRGVKGESALADYRPNLIDDSKLLLVNGASNTGVVTANSGNMAYYDKIVLPLGKYSLKKIDGSNFRELIFIFNADNSFSRFVGSYSPSTVSTKMDFELTGNENKISFFSSHPLSPTAGGFVLFANQYSSAGEVTGRGINTTDGTFVDGLASEIIATGYQTVKPNTSYLIFSEKQYSVRNLVAFYRADNSFISVQNVTGVTDLIKFTTPADCTKVIFFVKFYDDLRGNIVFVEQSDATQKVYLNSKKLKIGSTASFQPYQRIVRFQVDINTVNPLLTPSTAVDSAKDSETNYKDWGVLMLPTNYSETGAPVPLIIGCHGGGGTVTSTTSQTETYDLYKYLVSQGYAVMDMAGMPIEVATALAIDQYRVMGNFFTINAYQEGYDWVAKNYNIDRNGVFLTGGSNGGLTSHNIYAHSTIPIKVMAGMSPLLSMDNAWNIPTGAISGGTFTSYQNRANIIRLYGMSPVTTQGQLDAAVLDVNKVKGFDPQKYNVFDIAGTKYKIHKTPYKIWHPVDDPVVEIQKSRDFVGMIKNAGGYAILREMSSGGHAPESAGTALKTFTYNGASANVYPAMEELLLWFNRFRNNF